MLNFGDPLSLCISLQTIFLQRMKYVHNSMAKNLQNLTFEQKNLLCTAHNHSINKRLKIIVAVYKQTSRWHKILAIMHYMIKFKMQQLRLISCITYGCGTPMSYVREMLSQPRVYILQQIQSYPVKHTTPDKILVECYKVKI